MFQPSPVPHARPEAPKLRSSCDNCGIAKVKCGREHPQCIRCAGFGLTCVYGPSRFSGKAPRKRLTDNAVSNLPKRIFPSLQTTRNQDVLESPPIDDQGHIPFPDLTLAGSIDDWPLLDEWLGGQPTTSVPNLDTSSAHILDYDAAASHSCPRESYEIFRDLICPGPSLHAPQSSTATVTARFDEVLTFNRAAINRLTRLLDCPCAKSGHRAMVHASIVSRILIWYQQAAGWPTASPSSSPESPPGIEGSTSSAPSVQVTGFAVDPVPVTVGTFGVEDETLQAAIRIQLILSELKSLVEVIDVFGASQDLDEGSTGLYSHLGRWLHSEHARTVRILKARLCALSALNKL